MDWLQSVWLGIVQGVTEPLPVSSSAHLLIVPWLLKWTEQAPDAKLTFDLALHLGTALALVLCFHKPLLKIARAFLAPGRCEDAGHHRRLGILIVVGCIPAGLAGVFGEDIVENVFRSPVLSALPMGLFAVVLYLADHLGKKTRTTVDMKMRDALLIGCAQALALVPGVSRSGITMTASLFRGLRREDAATFSFLMMLPLTLGACLLKARHVLGKVSAGAWPGFWDHDFPLMALGAAVSFLVCALSITFLLRFLKKHSMDVFVVYRLIAALAVLGVYWWRTA